MRYFRVLTAVAVGCSVVGAIPTPQETPQADVCSLSARDPASWAASGGETQVADWISEKGETRWLYELDKSQNGDSTAIACASIGTTGCSTPQAACTTFTTKSYYFVLTMAARVNEVFSIANKKLTSSTIKDVLSIGKIINDFKIPVDPATGDAKYFQTTAAALSMSDKIVKQFAGPLGDLLGLMSGMFNLIAINNEVKVTDYAALERDMENYLSEIFNKTESGFERALASIFGEGEEGDTILEELLDTVSKMGLEGFKGDQESTISKILSGGAFMEPVSQSDVSKAFDNGFKSIRHGMIGNYLAGLQSFVQRDDTTKEGDCKIEQGKYWDGSKCNSLLVKGVTGKIEPFSDDTIKKFKDYDLSVEAMIKNVIECNNGEVDKSNFKVEGDYPKCFFGLTFADYIDGPTARRCYTNFKNWRDLPSWLFSREETLTKDCKDFNIPYQGNCVVNSGPVSDWVEYALRRYRTNFSGSNVDLSGICNYFTHSHCTGYSNVQCWKSDDGSYLVDISFVQGPLGKSQNDACIAGARDEFQSNNDCRTG